MPDIKEKLTDLFSDCVAENSIVIEPVAGDRLADYLIANGVTIQEWIAVEDERKPQNGRNCFISYVFGDSDMHFFGEAKYHAYGGNGIVDRPHFSNEGMNGMRVTHWMEIPKLPNR